MSPNCKVKIARFLRILIYSRLKINKKINLYISFHFPGGGGGLRIWKGWRCSSEILNKAPKGDRSGRVPSVFLTPKRDDKKYISNIYLYIFSRATLNETFTAKYDGVLPRTPPKWDQNPTFTPLSETTTSIPTHFICGVLPCPPPSAPSKFEIRSFHSEWQQNRNAVSLKKSLCSWFSPV